MPVLNDDVNLDAATQATFKGPIKRVELDPGYRLFKLSEYHPINPRNGGHVTDYWSDYQATDKGDWGWAGYQRMCNALNVGERELARITSAVKLEWNNLTWVWTITLRQKVWAWHGHTASQYKAGNSGPRLTGMNLQFYIPNLTPWHIHVVGRVRAT